MKKLSVGDQFNTVVAPNDYAAIWLDTGMYLVVIVQSGVELRGKFYQNGVAVWDCNEEFLANFKLTPVRKTPKKTRVTVSPSAEPSAEGWVTVSRKHIGEYIGSTIHGEPYCVQLFELVRTLDGRVDVSIDRGIPLYNDGYSDSALRHARIAINDLRRIIENRDNKRLHRKQTK